MAKKLEDFTPQDLIEIGWAVNAMIQLHYENGIQINGKLINTTFKDNKLLIMSFENCTVTDEENNIYFEPAWGIYDMAIGDAIVSVFNGTADKGIYEDQLYVSEQPTHQQNYTAKDLQYQSLFKQISNYREQSQSDDALNQIWHGIKNDFETDWLGAMELLELADTMPSQQVLANELRIYLNAQSTKYPAYAKLIRDGLKIIDAKLKFE